MDRSPGAQRWPPMLALVAGLLITFTALPNPLRIPNQPPTATAELAPVPGDDDSPNNPQGNFAETGLASSGGLGSEPEGGGGFPPLPPAKEIPSNYECVGEPARQSDDPLAPPCVPYYSGNNGGATWTGVTKNEIKVVLYNDLNIKGDMNAPYKPTDDQGGTTYDYVNIVKTIKAQLSYFNRRFQTYGRQVHVIATGSNGSTADARRRDAAGTWFKYRPFGVIWLGNEAGHYFAFLAKYGVPSFGLNEDVDTDLFEQSKPYMWSFYPDQVTEVRWSASYICRKLLGRTGPGDTTRLRARLALDPSLQNKPRKLAFIWNKASSRGPEIGQLGFRLKDELKKQCGYEFDYEGEAAKANAPRQIAQMKLGDITTVVCYCVPVPSELAAGTYQSAATAASYYPEWYWDHMSRMDKPIWQQTYGSKDQFSFGSSYYWRSPAFREQQHYRAYVEETKDGSVPNTRWNFNLYYTMLNLFTAIQAAGPTLTPETIERGMLTFKYTNPNDPWLPTGGYGPGRGAGTHYTFIDTAMSWWWDPTGTPPGSPKQGEGCQRVSQEGRRFYWDTWEMGDADIKTANDPCTEDRQRLYDPQPADY